jgi:hypothetical protein
MFHEGNWKHTSLDEPQWQIFSIKSHNGVQMCMRLIPEPLKHARDRSEMALLEHYASIDTH